MSQSPSSSTCNSTCASEHPPPSKRNKGSNGGETATVELSCCPPLPLSLFLRAQKKKRRKRRRKKEEKKEKLRVPVGKYCVVCICTRQNKYAVPHIKALGLMGPGRCDTVAVNQDLTTPSKTPPKKRRGGGVSSRVPHAKNGNESSARPLTTTGCGSASYRI